MLTENENVQKLLKQESYQIDSTPMGQDENNLFIVKTQIKTFEDGARVIEMVGKTVKESDKVIVKDVVGFAKGADEIEATEKSIIVASSLLGL